MQESMNAHLQKQLDRVEHALNALTESVTSYNPSVSAAQELLAADAALTEGINLLSHHQKNHALIASLTATLHTQTAQQRTALSLLADTRASVLAAPQPFGSLAQLAELARREGERKTTTAANAAAATSTGAGAAATTAAPDRVDPARVLSFARNAARFAAPPGYKPPSERNAVKAPGTEQPSPSGVEPQTAGAEQQQQQGKGGEGEEEEDEAAAAFVPWPADELFARSLLARSQGWASAAPEAVGEGVGGKEVKKEEDEDTDMAGGEGAGARAEGERQRPVAAVVEREKPKVFAGLDLYDPDAD